MRGPMSSLDGAAASVRRAMTSRLWLPCAIGVALLVRIGLVLHANGRFTFADEYDYDSLATSLLAGDGFSLGGAPSAFRPPGQAVFLAAVYALAGHRPMVAELAQAL